MNRSLMTNTNGNFSKSDESFVNDFNTTNTTAEEDYIENTREIDDWIIFTYFTFIGIAGLINATIIVGLLRCKRKGVLLLILQIAIVDLLTTFVIVLELLSLQKNSWTFSQDLCPLYSGSEILLNSLSIYLLLCLNFHVISVWNLYSHQISKGNKNPLTACDDDESNECLVKKNDTPTSSRSLTIDYRRKKNDVAVIFPSLLVWFICLSLSIPEYTLSSTIKVKNLTYNSTICVVIDTHYGQLLQNLLLIFKVIVPLPLMFSSFFLLLHKLYQSRSANNTLSKNLQKIKKIILVCVILTATYFTISLPRSILYVMHTRSQDAFDNTLDSFKSPPLYNRYISNYENAFVSMLHYSGVLIRSIIYIRFLPTFWVSISRKICNHDNDKNKD